MKQESPKSWSENVSEQAAGLRGAFSRQITFDRMLEFLDLVLRRKDALGISSLVRASSVKTVKEAEALYHGLLRFFRSKAWVPEKVMRLWAGQQMKKKSAWRVGGRLVVVGDHTNNTKEGRRMPGVRNVHQHSETSSKPDYCRAQQWGALAVVQQAGADGPKTGSCIYLQQHRFTEDLSMTERPAAEAVAVAKENGEKIQLVVDAAFGTGPFFRLIRASEGTAEALTRAKKNAVAFESPPPRQPGQRGRTKIYGPKIVLNDVFKSPDGFTTETVDGDEIRHRKLVLLTPIMSPTRQRAPSPKEKAARKKSAAATGVAPKRGRPKKVVQPGDAVMKKPKSKSAKVAAGAAPPSAAGVLKLAYFCISSARGSIVLFGTDLELSAADAYRLYQSRPVIESFFRVFKHLFHGFDAHFWSDHIKSASRSAGVDRNADLDARLDNPQAQAALKATEGHAVLMAILTGMLQNLCLERGDEILADSNLWMRTPSQTPSEFLLLMLIRDQALQKDRLTA